EHAHGVVPRVIVALGSVRLDFCDVGKAITIDIANCNVEVAAGSRHRYRPGPTGKSPIPKPNSRRSGIHHRNKVNVAILVHIRREKAMRELGSEIEGE